MATAAFPSELVGLIIDEVTSHADLYHLSLVSRDFNYWAGHRLYRRLHITGSTSYMEKSFISLAKRPHLAAHVTDMEIRGFWEADSSVIPFIEPAFRSMINLKSLAINITNWYLCVIQPDMAFRLHAFAYLGCYPQMQLEEIHRKLTVFLVTQVDLERLKLTGNVLTNSGVSLTPQVLPRLTVLDVWVEEAQPLLTMRSVIHLTARTIGRQNRNRNLITDVSTLRSLCITFDTCLPLYRGCFPNLRFLQVMKTKSVKRILYLEQMPVLEKIKMNEYPPCAKTVVTQSFAACPSLQRIEIHTGDPWQSRTKTWIRDVEEPLHTRNDATEWMYA